MAYFSAFYHLIKLFVSEWTRFMNQCFQVQDRNDKYLQGKEKTKQVVKKLLKLPLNQQPDDFQNLVDLLQRRILT